MTVKHSFQTLFAVPMTCDSCVRDVSDAVHRLDGITKVEAKLQEQLVEIEGTGAAVSILETYQHLNIAETAEERARRERDVKGLARVVQVSPAVTLVDLTVRGLPPGGYRVTIREYGDLKDGVTSAGPVWIGSGAGQPEDSHDIPTPRGHLGVVEVGEDGYGGVFAAWPFQVWEVIGHAMVVSPADKPDGEALCNDAGTVAGVIARSAGMWDNDKTVCSCTGKTLWEERKTEVKKGML